MWTLVVMPFSSCSAARWGSHKEVEVDDSKKVVTIGHVDHGKTILTAILTFVAASAQPPKLFTLDEEALRAAEEHYRKQQDWSADRLGVPRRKWGPL